VLTGKRDLAIVPNSTIAKSKIVNVSSPSGIHGVTITVQLDAKTPPATGTEILEHAILNCRLIVATPTPSVTIKSINATCTEFEITFFVEELASSTRAQNQLFDLIFRHLAVAGVDLATAQDQPEPVIGDQASIKLTTGRERLLELVAIFASLTTEERKAIAAKLKQKSYDKGETLVEPGTVVHSLFIVGTGVYELAKDDLTPFLEARSEVSQGLCRALAQRQAAGQLVASNELAEAVPANRLTTWFSERLHRLHDIASVA